MRKEQCFYVGKITKKHSYKGEVVIYLDTDEPHLYKNMESIFVALGTNLVPFFLEKSNLHKGNHLRVKFDDIDTEQDADAIIGSEVYLPLEMLPKLEGDKFYYHEIIGFKVEDTSKGYVGIIKHINDAASQPLIEIDNNGTEIMIPLVDDFIKKVDRKNATFFVDLPEGLIDLYLEQS